MSENESEDSLLQSIGRGAVIFGGGKGVQTGIGFFLNVILTWGLRTQAYGVYTYARTILQLVSNFADFGASKTVLRYLPIYTESSEQSLLIGLGSLSSLTGSLLIAVGIFLFAPTISKYTLHTTDFVGSLKIFAVLLPFYSLSKLISNIFRSIEAISHYVFIQQIAEPIMRLVCIAIALGLGYSLTGAVWATVIAGIIVFLIAAFLGIFRTQFRPSLDGSTDNVMKFYNFSLPLAMRDVSAFLYSRMDILMVGFLLTEASSVGVYNIAVLLSSLLALPLSGFNQLFPPIAARLLDANEKQKLQQVHGILCRWTITVTLLIAAGIAVYTKELLGIFGQDFISGRAVVLTLLFGQLLNAIAFGTGYILMVSDHQYYMLGNQLFFGVVNVVLNYFLINQFGIVGAAAATMSVYAGLNVIRIIEVWYLEGLFPYTLQFLKPVIAIVPTTGVMYLSQSFLSGVLVLIIGPLIGMAIFLGLLFVLGIEEEDKAFVRNRLIKAK